MLSAYSSSLSAYHARTAAIAMETGKPRKSLDGWEKAIGYIDTLRGKFRTAESNWEAGLIEEANTNVEKAMELLKLRYDLSKIGSNVYQACPILQHGCSASHLQTSISPGLLG
jgi:hypothetical protein